MVLVSLRCQVPSAIRPCQVGERGRAGLYSGMKVPGEWGRARGDGGLRRVVEDGVDKVLALAPPTAENSGIVSPFGATRTAVRPESCERRDAERDGDVGDLKCVVRIDGQRRVERAGTPDVVAAGIVWSIEVEPKVCGPRIEPVGPMIDSTWLGVKLLTCTGRSKVTSNWLVESSVSRLPVPVETAPEVPTAWVVRTCGPLMISGTRVLIERRERQDALGRGERDRRLLAGAWAPHRCRPASGRCSRRDTGSC